MAIVINGSGTVTGLSVGGLPDGTVDDGTLASNAVTEAKIATDAVTAAKIPASLENTFVSGRKNIIINGAMQFAQRGTSITVAGSSIYTLDRWSMRCDASTITATQDTDSPTGFATSLKLTNGTGASGSGTDSCYIRQHLEGHNTNHLEIGTANAKEVTLSFWVKSSITGTYIVSFLDSGSDNGYAASYTISSANTWEQKTITLTLSDYGSWAGSSTTARNLTVHFDLGSGSDRDLTNLNAWNDGATNDFSHSSQTDWVGTTGATLYLTGVQLELGSTATDFEYRSYGEELALCQRYYQKLGGAETLATGAYTTSSRVDAVVPFIKEMRVAPTLTVGSGSNYWYAYRNSAIDYFDSWSGTGRTKISCNLYVVSGVSGTAGHSAQVQCNNAGASILCDAEL
jgi:hypothetical protein